MREACSWYAPGGRPCRLYLPCWLVNAERLVFSTVTRTEASGAPPARSVTVPVIPPCCCCAGSRVAPAPKSRAAASPAVRLARPLVSRIVAVLTLFELRRKQTRPVSRPGGDGKTPPLATTSTRNNDVALMVENAAN